MRATLVAIVGVVAIAAGAAAAQTTVTPRLEVSDRAPLVLHGSGFAARERVGLAVRIDGDLAAQRTIVTTYRGSFVARFAEIRLDACTGATLVATGRRSDTVRLKISLRECPGPAIDYP
jgi:hypothetical protein